jgi:hypothetical protein
VLYAKSTFLAALVLSITLQSSADAPALQSDNESLRCYSASITSTSNQTAVVQFSAYPMHDGEAYVGIDWGDGSDEGGGGCWGPGCCTGSDYHVYDCPGTYTIIVYAYFDMMEPLLIGSGTVAIQPLPGFALVLTSGGNNEVQLETADVINQSNIVESTVDWGDGTDVEPFVWIACSDSTLCLPPHKYPHLGDFDIVVVNRYDGECPFERSDSLRVSVDTLTPVDHRTWGAIKALYR